MKIAAIAKVIKDRGSCHIVRIHGAEDTETSMFIGTGSELYSLEGFPKPWTEAEIMTMLGMQKKQWEDVIYKEYLCDTAEDVCGMNLEDALQNEIECRKSSINLCIGGALLMGLMTPDEKTIDFIPVSKLAPVMDEIKKERLHQLLPAPRKERLPILCCPRRDDGAGSNFADHAVGRSGERYAEYREYDTEHSTVV